MKKIENLTEWVFSENNDVFTTSLKVAELFSKNHKEVLRDIRVLTSKLKNIEKSADLRPAKILNEQGTKLFATKISNENPTKLLATKVSIEKILKQFIKIKYKGKNNKVLDAYQLTKDAFILLTMGYSTKEALKIKVQYINMFNDMLNIINKERDNFYSIMLKKEDNLYNMSEVAKLTYEKLHIGRNTLYLTLRKKNIINSENIPYQKYINDKYFSLRTTNKGYSTMLVTPKGINFILRVVEDKEFTNDDEPLQLKIEFEYK